MNWIDTPADAIIRALEAGKKRDQIIHTIEMCHRLSSTPTLIEEDDGFYLVSWKSERDFAFIGPFMCPDDAIDWSSKMSAAVYSVASGHLYTPNPETFAFYVVRGTLDHPG